ncbi:uncharacterized protein LOC106876819 [Octopus bimaculoides]|uniref:uncharacterized protein LOC106876819 n=1 Tax=Octopus bimaculoides TaxID=37653 RepID=UPI00071E5798|nr:uncharacterized protein LOC106876819 [Octopus bimaculoides]|eukprot:XP_014781018.1 PREDICTED: uncharacterized protein LOC106876819 [Octopus bimaculoides]
MLLVGQEHDKRDIVLHLRDSTLTDTVQLQMEAPKNTTLTAFFKLCQNDEFATKLLYNEVPHVYTRYQNKWKRCALEAPTHHPGIKKSDTLGRIYVVHPNYSECYYLRLLLHHVKGPTSFTALRMVDNTVCQTYRQACHLRGLQEDDTHWKVTLTEAQMCKSPMQLRNIFSIVATR